MEPLIYEGLTVSVRKTDAGDAYQFGIVLFDSFLPFAAYKAGAFEEDIASAVAAQAAAKNPAPDAPAATPAPDAAAPVALPPQTPAPPTTTLADDLDAAEKDIEAAKAHQPAASETTATFPPPAAPVAPVPPVDPLTQ